MTPDEHQLVIYMLQMQQVTITAVIETLKERGYLKDGDIEVITQVLAEKGTKRLVESRVEEAYRVAGQALGVHVRKPLGDVP